MIEQKKRITLEGKDVKNQTTIGMSFREKLFLAVTTFFVAYLTVPIFMLVTGVNISVVSVFTFVSIFVLYPKAFNNNVTIAGLVYLFVLVSYHLVGQELPAMGAGDNPDMVRLVMATAFILPNLSIFYVMKYLNSPKIYKYICYSSLIAITISFISFAPLIIADNGALRLTTMDSTKVFVDPRLPHYSLLHAYIMLFPATLLTFKLMKSKWRFFFLGVSIIIFYIIVKSAITTTMLIAVMEIGIMLIYNPKSESKSLVRIGAFSMVVVLLWVSGAVSAFMDATVGYYEDTSAENKMRYFSDLLAGNQVQTGNSMEIREELHRRSINAFLEHPLFGGGQHGGHSSILDRLGCLGLVGFIPYAIFLIVTFKYVYQIFKNKMYRITFGIVAFCALILLYQKGLFGQECWLFFIVLSPAVLKHIENELQYQ